ncbi:MAG: hypothetical protein SchgKO_02960 [Schleiferiaceae bacterium]
MRNILVLGLTLCMGMAHGQKQRLIPNETFDISQVKQDLSYLASDELIGRFPGTDGEKLAAAYIEKQFRSLGLVPLGTEEYKQAFSMYIDAEVDENNYVIYKKDTLSYPHELYPIKYSGNGTATGKTMFLNYAISAPKLDYDDLAGLDTGDLEGRIAVMDLSSPDGIHPHSKYVEYYSLEGRLKHLVALGAEGIIVINAGQMANDAQPRFERIYSVGVPVLFVGDDEWAETLSSRKRKVTISASAHEKQIQATNMVGFLNRGKEKTVVIGAHYDHLGMGTSSSLYRGEPQIHNGADDNASGSAGLLALARYLSKNADNYSTNFLFIAFSGEEEGLLGSSYWTQNPTLPTDKLKYMLNMDMIGRLDIQEPTLEINGVGTSPVWNQQMRNLPNMGMKIRTTESGIGPSDQTSFYHIKVPAIHFFTGTHSDYHKPSDDARKINFKGEVMVLTYMVSVINAVDSIQEMPFTKTANSDARKAPRFSVTLGVIPDYAFDGKGMKINGVTEGKPAANAGLQEGDVVTQIGKFSIVDMYSYMDALAAFQKGDQTKVTYLRDGKEITVDLQF